MDGAAIVLTTFETRDDAVRVVGILVGEHLAACGNIVPGVESIYRWKEKVEHASEVLVLLKCPADRLERLRERLLELHRYEVPEFIALLSSETGAAYLAWLREACDG